MFICWKSETKRTHFCPKKAGFELVALQVIPSYTTPSEFATALHQKGGDSI